MAQTAPSKSNFFVRSNYPAEARDARYRDTLKQYEGLRAAIQASSMLAEEAIGVIEQGKDAETGLDKLRSSLLQITSCTGGDPGIRMAAQDLFSAAAALVMDKPVDPAVVDIRRWRLLKEAHSRLRRRLEDRT